MLVAVMVAEPAAGGAVKRPAAVMAPEDAVHVTAELYLPVPVTVAAHCAVAPAFNVVGLQAALTEVMVDPGGAGCWTMTDAAPATTGSWLLVAVMVTIPAEAGAVKAPLAVIVPAEADQFTAVL